MICGWQVKPRKINRRYQWSCISHFCDFPSCCALAATSDVYRQSSGTRPHEFLTAEMIAALPRGDSTRRHKDTNHAGHGHVVPKIYWFRRLVTALPGEFVCDSLFKVRQTVPQYVIFRSKSKFWVGARTPPYVLFCTRNFISSAYLSAWMGELLPTRPLYNWCHQPQYFIEEYSAFCDLWTGL